MDTSIDNSHYQSAFSTPVKTQISICQQPTPSGEEGDDQSEGSSLASTSLDFSCLTNENDDDDQLQQPFFTTAIEENSTDNLQLSATSSPTLVEERLKTLKEPPSPAKQKSFSSTNPFVDHHFRPQGVAKEEENIQSLLNNLNLLSSRLTEVESVQKQLTDQLSELCRSARQINRESARILEKILIHREKVSADQQQIMSTKKMDAQTQTDECALTENQIEPQTVELDISTLQHRFRKLPALVRGYLVRRLMRTEKVVTLKRTITDTSRILVQFKTNLLRESGGKLVVTHSDISFHKRLCDQLETACRQFYAVFIELPAARRMEIIAQHREHLKRVRYLESRRTGMSSSSSSVASSSRPVSRHLQHYHFQGFQQKPQQSALLNLM